MQNEPTNTELTKKGFDIGPENFADYINAHADNPENIIEVAGHRLSAVMGQIVVDVDNKNVVQVIIPFKVINGERRYGFRLTRYDGQSFKPLIATMSLTEIETCMNDQATTDTIPEQLNKMLDDIESHLSNDMNEV